MSAELRELRRRSGLALEDVARPLGFSVSHLSRVENGIRKPRPDDVGALLGFYRVPTPRRDDLVALAREGQSYNWWQADDGSFSMLESFMIFEREATVLRNYELSVIPGLLQVPEYTRALCRGANENLTDDDVEKIIKYRTMRQQDWRRTDGPPLHVIVDEGACRRALGGNEVLCDQLRHVVEEASTSKLTVQVVPASVASHPGLDGSFMLLDLGLSGDLLYTEIRGSAAFLEDPAQVMRAKQAFWRLCALACSPDDSLNLVTSIIDEVLCDLGGPGGERATPQLAQEQPQQRDVQLRRSGVR